MALAILACVILANEKRRIASLSDNPSREGCDALGITSRIGVGRGLQSCFRDIKFTVYDRAATGKCLRKTYCSLQPLLQPLS